MKYKFVIVLTGIFITMMLVTPLRYEFASDQSINGGPTFMLPKLVSVYALFDNTNQTSVDPLPSWKDGVIKKNIISFVQNSTDKSNTKYFIAPENRIAVFDNDGTLWSEKPLYFQIYFALDRVPQTIAHNPALKNQFPFNMILQKNFTALSNATEKDIMNLVAATHSNITETEFNNLVHQWSKTARHPQTNKLFTEMVYQPMLELLKYLEANQFKNFIVSGGGIDFIRESLSSVYNIPPERIIGSSLKSEFIDKFNNNVTNNTGNNNTSYLIRTPALGSIDDKYGKPPNIQLHIGKIPVLVAGNSDGDLQMLEYVSDNNPKGKSLELLIHHDDKAREFSYDKGAEKALEEAKNNDWNIVSMQSDFIDIFPNVNGTTNQTSAS
jgi:phosphoglycolate phosphatase-like HAD superfamily hydrolase